MAATLLGLPPEMRLWIYELVIADRYIYLSDNNEEPGVVRNAFALPQVCGLIRDMSSLSDLTFHIHHSDRYYLDQWLDAMGPGRLLQVRKMAIEGSTVCHLAYDGEDIQ
ncbi:hypothetical protein LTR08_008430 [Meristemomyces frigidus]|nr:hypothetical protein LTR08_008430 [Meristemomyces frigidus]